MPLGIFQLLREQTAGFVIVIQSDVIVQRNFIYNWIG